MKRKLTPHQRIMRAAKARKGLRLTAGEVFHLSKDSAIETRAEWDDRPDDEAEERAIDAERAKGECPHAARCDCLGGCKRGMRGNGAVEVKP